MKMVNWLRNTLVFSVVTCAAAYVVVYLALSQKAYAYSSDDSLPLMSNPTAVVLGNRAKTKGIPNICMTGRVDKAMSLLSQHGGTTLLLSGGVDPVEQSFESQVMANHALGKGYSARSFKKKSQQPLLKI
jgi:vancomycin permeability regulator SanA